MTKQGDADVRGDYRKKEVREKRDYIKRGNQKNIERCEKTPEFHLFNQRFSSGFIISGK